MSEALQAFAAAFLGDTAKYINERKDKAEDYADKLRETAERNKSVLAKLRSAAKAQQGYISQARGLYASDAMIEAALDAGPTGVKDLVDQLSTMKTNWGTGYNEDLVKELKWLPEGFKATGNLDPMTRYGLDKLKVGDVETPERSLFDKAFGRGAKDAARYELDREKVGDTGLSVFDLAELSSTSGYESLNPSSYLSYTAPKIFNPTKFEAARGNLADVAREATLSPTYKALDDELEQKLLGLNTPEERAALRQTYADKKKAYVDRQLQLHVNGQTALYGDSYVKTMASVLKEYGLDYTSFLEEEDVVTEPGQEPADDAVTGATQPEITVTELPTILEQTEEQFTIPKTNLQVRVVTTPEGPRLQAPNGEVMSKEDTEALVTGPMELTMEQFEKSYPVNVGPENVTTNEKNEGLTNPFKPGDPRPSDGFMASRVDKYRAEVWDEMFGKTHNPDGTPIGQEAQEDVREESVGSSEKLLSQFGADIAEYMTENGLTTASSDEEIKEVLADWYNDNSTNIAIPALTGIDDDIIIKTIRLALNDEVAE